ncbi:MAG: type II 3-dehydroquinate dehydratase [Pseudomonadota bacterium]
MGTASDTGVIAVLNGPNLNLLGTRQPEIYGTATLQDIEDLCRDRLTAAGLKLRFSQSNSEGALVTAVQDSRDCSAVLINAAGYTHTSVALLDALLTISAPVIEVHLSNPHAREEIRHRSIIAPACQGIIAGFGPQSYALALDAAIALIDGHPIKAEG